MDVEKMRGIVANYCTSSRCEDCVLAGANGVCRITISLADKDLLSWAMNEISRAKDEANQTETLPQNDVVNRPAHYTDGKIEVIEFIEDKKLGFCLGNAVKYIARAGKKDPTKEVEDLKKARWYIERRIKEIEGSIV